MKNPKLNIEPRNRKKWKRSNIILYDAYLFNLRKVDLSEKEKLLGN
jgi:hypothetical protein